MKSQFRVLIFFVISGAVIQLSNKKALTLKTTKTYLLKRAVRLYPIYFISILFALLVSQRIYPIGVIIKNLLFCQILFAPVILENGPIWTLHYEAIFYLLFIPISFFKINPKRVAIIAFLIGFGNLLLPVELNVPLLTSYCFGFVFWCTGLIVVQYFPNKNEHTQYNTLVSYLLLIIALPYINHLTALVYQVSMFCFGRQLANSLGDDIHAWFSQAFDVYNITFLPFCFMAVILFSNRSFKYQKVFLGILQLIPAYTLICRHLAGDRFPLKTNLFPIICYATSCIILFLRWNFIQNACKKIITIFIWFGNFSYGIYIIHIPVLEAFNRVSLFSGNVYTLIIRFILYLVITFVIAYLLEIKLQPIIRNKFIKASKDEPQTVI